MIIWSRWGIIAFFFVGIGIGLGFLLKAVVGLGRETGPVSGMFVGLGLLVAAVGLFVFDRFVVAKHLDRPRPMTVTRQLAVPYQHPDGRVQTHEAVPIVDQATGQQVIMRPRSTLFFIPMAIWPFVIAAIGLTAFVVGTVGTVNSLPS